MSRHASHTARRIEGSFVNNLLEEKIGIAVTIEEGRSQLSTLIYHGRSEKSGDHRFKDGQTKILGTGITQLCGPNGWPKLSEKERESLPRSPTQRLQHVYCVHHSSAELLRFIGILRPFEKSAAEEALNASPCILSSHACVPRLSAEQEDSLTAHTASTLGSATNAASSRPILVQSNESAEVEQKKQARSARQEKAYQRELVAIMAQRSLGLDPLISITYLSHISGRSISTLYRAFGKELPKPIKVGSRSRVPYSAAVAYIAAR